MTLLHIGTDIAHFLGELIAMLDRARAENPQLRLIIRPVR